MNTSDLIASISLLFSVVSLGICWLTYRRDKGHVSFVVKCGHDTVVPLHGRPIKGVYFHVVNTGRRPVILNGMYADTQGWFRRLAGRVAPKRYPSECWLPPGPIASAILYNNNAFRTLGEGEIFQHFVDHHFSAAFARALGKDAVRIYVTDTLGQKYFVSRRDLAKFKSDAETMFPDTEGNSPGQG